MARRLSKTAMEIGKISYSDFVFADLRTGGDLRDIDEGEH
jgi:hypothetical protein